jgi:L-threonylcarbamoyladenylate synthase
VLQDVAVHLRAEGLVSYPTETVYGFGCLAREAALERLFRLKDREPDKPVLLLVSGPSQVESLRWNPAALALARAFWPGALTLVLSDASGSFPAGIRSTAGGVAVRQSPNRVAAALVECVGEPLTSTSANAPGEEPARSGEEAWEVAGALGAGGSLWVLDAGELPFSAPSTVVDCSDGVPVVIRAGAVGSRELQSVIAEIHGQD